MICEVWASFEDAGKTVINAVFGAPQDINYWPWQDQIWTDDQRYLDFAAKFPDPLTWCADRRP